MEEASFHIFPNENYLDLRLYQYGREQCAPLHSFGPFRRNHYLFHYVISGRGTLDSTASDGMDRHYVLEANQGFLIWPGQINTYCADWERPWKYVWLEFDGLRAEEFLSGAGLSADQPIYRPQSVPPGEAVREIMEHIVDHSSASSLYLIGQLYLFMDSLIRSSATRRSVDGRPLRDFYIQEAVAFMENNFRRELTVEEIADVCKLNRSYFSKLFRESMGCPPQEFLIQMRLSKATEMMKAGGASIGDIAAQCGYPNQLHFSRAFKKRYGVSPREWRAQNKYHPKG